MHYENQRDGGVLVSEKRRIDMKRLIAKDQHKGAALILASTVAFCLMSGLVRYASDIDPY